MTTSAKPFTDSEVRSGFFVVASFVIILALLFMSGSAQLFQATYKFHILYNYISGLKENAPVHLAGHEVGKVTGIEFQGGETPKVKVTVSLRKDAVVREDSQAHINILGFMGETYVELSPGTGGSPALQENGTLTGTDPVPMMELVRRGTELLDEFEKISDSLEHLTGDLKGLVGENKQEFTSIVQNLDASSANLKDMTQDLKGHPWKLLRKPD